MAFVRAEADAVTCGNDTNAIRSCARAAVRLLQGYPVEKVLIEDSASGPGLHAMLAAKGFRSELRPVGGRNKQERLEKHLHFFVGRRIYVLNNQPVDFRNELVGVPVGRHDDRSDALTLYLEFMFSNAQTRPLILSAKSSAEQMIWKAVSLWQMVIASTASECQSVVRARLFRPEEPRRRTSGRARINAAAASLSKRADDLNHQPRRLAL
jgi:hypothetical protein